MGDCCHLLLQLRARAADRGAIWPGRGARGAISPGRCAWWHVWRGHGPGAGTTQGVAEKGRAPRRESTVIFASLFRGDFEILLCCVVLVYDETMMLPG